MQTEQTELFDPTGREIFRLAECHAKRIKQAMRVATQYRAWGARSLADWWDREAERCRREIEDLAMLAEFERLGGVSV